MPKLNSDLIECKLELTQETYDFAKSNLRELYMDCTIAGFKRAGVMDEKKFESMFNAINESLETLRSIAEESVKNYYNPGWEKNKKMSLGKVVIVNNFLRETVGNSNV